MKNLKIPMAALVLALAAMLQVSCAMLQGGYSVPNQLNPTPYNPGEPILLGTIWEDAQPVRRTVAGDRYRHRWVVIKVDSVNTGTADGRLLVRMPSPPNTIELRYNHPEHADAARNDRDFIVLCNVGGVNAAGDRLVLHHCRPTDKDGKPVD